MSIHWGGRGPGHVSRWSKAASAPSALTQLKALLAGSTKSAIWTPTDLSTVFTDSGVTPATAGQQIKQCNDVSGNSNHLTQASLGKRPVATKGLTFDQLDDYMFAAMPGGAGSADMTIVAGLYRDTSNIVTIQGQATASSSSNILGVAKSSGATSATGASSGTPTYAINGTAVPGGTSTTVLQLYTAWTASQFVRFAAKNADLSTWPDFGFGFFSGNAGLVTASAVVLLDNVALGANAAAALTLAQQLIDQTNGGL